MGANAGSGAVQPRLLRHRPDRADRRGLRHRQPDAAGRAAHGPRHRHRRVAGLGLPLDARRDDGAFAPGHATRAGVQAALLAARGFDCSTDALEADKGFADVFSANVDHSLATKGLGQDFEILRNGYKPYPSGIVIHPTIDACLALHKRIGAARIAGVRLTVHPLALKLCGVREPTTPLEAHVSLHHWAAAALLRGAAGLQEFQMDCIADPAVARLRAGVVATADSGLGKGVAVVEATLSDGRALREHVLTPRGGVERPMDDDALDAKFRGQAAMTLPPERIEPLLRQCREAARLDNVGPTIAALCAV